MSNLHGRVTKLEQTVGVVSIAERLREARERAKRDGSRPPSQTRAQLEEIVRTSRSGSLRQRMASGQLRIGDYLSS